MKHMLVSLSRDVIRQGLESELESHQRKHDYHKKLTQEYESLIQQTQKKMEEFM